MLFCILHHPMDAKTHNIPPGELKFCFSVGVRPAHHQEKYCLDICGGCVQCLVSADLIACRLNQPVIPKLWSGLLVWLL